MVVGEKLVDKKKLLDLCPGEFDRLFVSLYGGFSVCDNRRKEVLRRGEMETMEVVVAVPAKREKPTENSYRITATKQTLYGMNASKATSTGPCA